MENNEEKKISKKKLIALSGISVYDYRKMRENRDANVSVIQKVCLAFSLDIWEVIIFKSSLKY